MWDSSASIPWNKNPKVGKLAGTTKVVDPMPLLFLTQTSFRQCGLTVVDATSAFASFTSGFLNDSTACNSVNKFLSSPVTVWLSPEPSSLSKAALHSSRVALALAMPAKPSRVQILTARSAWGKASAAGSPCFTKALARAQQLSTIDDWRWIASDKESASRAKASDASAEAQQQQSSVWLVFLLTTL